MENIKWKLFILNEVFDINSTNYGIDKNKLIHKDVDIYPYVTRTEDNNGVDSFVGKQEPQINEGNVIIIGLDTQTVFYQQHPFYTGQNIQILSNPNLTRHNALFIITLLKKVLSKFNWGGNGATLTRLKKSRILLPINEDNMPNYKFMEEFMIIKEKELINNYTKHLKTRNLGEVYRLTKPQWKEIKLGDIFEIKGSKTTSLNDLKNKNVTDLKYPYVTTKSINNGIDGFFNYFTEKGGVLTVDSATDGNVFYQKTNFSASDHVEKLIPKFKMNKHIGLFIVSALSFAINGKYGYGYKFSQKRIKRQTLYLPFKDNELDFNFMEQYMFNLEINLLNKYKNYLER